MSTVPPPPSDAARDATNLARLVGLRKMREGRSENREAEAEEQQSSKGSKGVVWFLDVLIWGRLCA